MRCGVWSSNLKNQEAMARVGPQRDKGKCLKQVSKKILASVAMHLAVSCE